MNYSPIIEMKGVTKRFDKNRVTVFEDMNVRVMTGKITGLIGENGSGKTTFIKMVSGIVEPDGGNIYINGVEINKNFKAVRQKISVLSDINRSLYWNLNGCENIEYFSAIKNLRKDTNTQERINYLLDKFDMNHFIYKKVEHYSKGMKQRLMLLIALLNDPKLLILDEPINGLDFENVLVLKDMLRQSVKENNLSVLLTSHERYFIEEMCDNKLKIENKKIVPVTNTLHAAKKVKLYLRHPSILQDAYFSSMDFKVIDEEKNIYSIESDINDTLLYQNLSNSIQSGNVEVLYMMA